MTAPRRPVARFLAARLHSDRARAIQAAASWLVASQRRQQAAYLSADVAALAANQGYVFARIITARPVSPAARTRLQQFLRRVSGAKRLELAYVIEPNVIGGVRLEIPGSELDATVTTVLRQLVDRAGTS